MTEESRTLDVVRFGPFELWPETQELRKHGIPVRLSGQAIQVLVMLTARPGRLVTRDELRKKLWPGDSFGDFDHGLNAAVNKLRGKLGDSATTPKYVETLAGRGYRFIFGIQRPDGGAGPGNTVSSYRILEISGRGETGIVYKAQDLKPGRNVALKFVPEELATDNEVPRRFCRESSIASSLSHPNICIIYILLDAISGRAE